MSSLLLEVNGLSKRFCRRPERAFRYASQDILRELLRIQPQTTLRPGEFWALRNIDLELHKGEVLGVIGHNGAGKSTLINLIAGLIRPTEGYINLYTNSIALIDNNGGLNMVQTGRENISTQLALHGCSEELIRAELESVIEFAEIGEFIDSAVGTYSLGMRLRLAFSIYTRLKPDLFIVDEALSAGDLKFQAKFLAYIREYLNGGGSILLCSHDLFTIQALCRNCILLDHGTVSNYGETRDVVAAYHKLMEPAATAEQLAVEAAPVTTLEEAEDSSLSGLQDLQPAEPALTPFRATTAEELATNQEVDPDLPQILSLTCSPVDGENIMPGKPMIVEMTCHSPQEYEAIVFGMHIGRETLFPMAALGSGFESPRFALKTGLNTLTCFIEWLPFVVGTYQLRPMLYDAQTSAILAGGDMKFIQYEFVVYSPPSLETNIAPMCPWFVHMDARWSGTAAKQQQE